MRKVLKPPLAGVVLPRGRPPKVVVKQGIVPTTCWSDDDYEEPFEMGDTSWDHHQSGHSESGVNELTAIMGGGHGFETVKALRVFRTIIQIWCRPDGIVFDPFAGSGTFLQASKVDAAGVLALEREEMLYLRVIYNHALGSG